MLPFLAIAAFTVVTAAVALSLRNLIHSALLLVASWAGIAAFYLWAGAEFVAFAQLLVYVGAISMVVLFAVLLTRHSRADLVVARDSLGRAVAGIATGAAVLVVMVSAVLSTRFVDSGFAPLRPGVTVAELGKDLMTTHAAALLVVGLLLTVALLGAVVIAASDRPNTRAARGGAPAKPNVR